ncbi:MULTISPECIES: hypothetical protein [Lysobacter]|uniref:Tox-PL domain-containing protein n=1 Tax=Lysobacter firmicutimachus TaxID=1792846 RepID=A0ABU8CY93_9GAMM|nr:hypothetical protein [Lysobacter antibioticus]
MTAAAAAALRGGDIDAAALGGIANSVGAAEGLTLPGMSRPVRAINPNFPPSQAGVDAMNSVGIRNMANDIRCVDCNEIAESMLRTSNGEGRILEARPLSSGNLNVFENGSLEPGQWYHQVYTDGRYVFDPRLSPTPVPKGDWLQHIRGINPDRVIFPSKPKGFP